MQEENRKNTRYGKLNIFIVLLAGFLACCMVVMMYIGGAVNVREFLSSGRVYDFLEKDLQASSEGWQYSQEDAGYWIQKPKAQKKWKIGGKDSYWSFLYLTVEKMSVPEMELHVIYYGRDGSKVIEQTEQITEGENIIILLYPEVEMYQMGLRLYGAKGQFLSIASMQLREKASGIFVRRFVKLMAISYVGFLITLAALVWARGKFRRKIRDGNLQKKGQYMETLPYIYQVMIEDICRAIHQKTSGSSRKFVRKLLWCLLFLWMAMGNLSGWYRDGQAHRYYVLSVSLIILAIAILIWEKPLTNARWGNPICFAWLWLWIGTILSDVFVVSNYKWHGIPMVFACGILIFLWNHMKHPEKLIEEILRALEIDFIVAVLYCMLFRTKKLAIHYNGLFKDSEHFSMYAALMLAVFLVEIGNLMGKEKFFPKSVKYVTGAAISLFFVLRSADRAGFAAAAVALLIFLVWKFYSRKAWMGQARALAVYGMKAGIIAFFCVCAVHVSTKYLPAFLGTEIDYEDEALVSSLSPELMEAFDAMEPGLMEGVVSVQDTEYEMCWKNYMRRLGLTGSGSAVKVRRKSIKARSTYIQMMYRYGIFILIPFLVLQICLVQKGILRIRAGRKEDVWILMTGAIFICFCFVGDADLAFGHPLWFCYYAGVGFWFNET